MSRLRRYFNEKTSAGREYRAAMDGFYMSAAPGSGARFQKTMRRKERSFKIWRAQIFGIPVLALVAGWYFFIKK